MKIHLASFMQQNNFGAGRVISITHGTKPYNINVKAIFEPLSPPEDLVSKYNSTRASEPEAAGKLFVEAYTQQLKTFFENVKKDAEDKNVSVIDLLPFQEGDTLCSWERKEYANYRKILAPFLEEAGYDVVLA